MPAKEFICCRRFVSRILKVRLFFIQSAIDFVWPEILTQLAEILSSLICTTIVLTL
jgi:hypothetical protein